MKNAIHWQGTASELVNAAIEMESKEDAQPLPKDFPRSAARLGDHLTRRKDVLEKGGYFVERSRNSSSRHLTIRRELHPKPSSSVLVTRPAATATTAAA